MGLGRVTRPHEHRANPACTLRGDVCVLTRTHLGVPLCVSECQRQVFHLLSKHL